MTRQITAFQTVLFRLAASGVRCTVESDARTNETWASIHFADTSHLTWHAISDTSVEDSATHPVSAHRALSALYTSEYGDDIQLFDTGDFDRDVTALGNWITHLTETCGATDQ